MKLPKEVVGRRVMILLEGIPVAEIKVTSITTDEIIGEYSDGEEIHCSHEHLRAWWYGKAIVERKPLSEEQKRKMKEGRRKKQLADPKDN